MLIVNILISFCVIIFNFGMGFKLSEIAHDIVISGYSFDKLYPLIFCWFLILVLYYRVTLKKGGYNILSTKSWGLVLGLYVVPLIAGFLFWKY